VERELSPGRSRTLNRWLGDLGPIVVIGVVLWVKLVHISILLPSVSWAGSELLNVVTIVRAYPDVLSATLAAILLAVAPLLLLPRLWRVIFLLGIDLFLTTIAVSDLVHVRFYADVPSVSDISRSHMLQWVTESILTLMRPIDAFYFADIALGIIALPFYARAFRRTPDVTWADARRYGLGCVVCGFVVVTPTARLALDSSGIFDHSTLRLEAASSVGLLPYHLSDLVMNLTFEGRTVGEAETRRARLLLEELRRRRAVPSELFGAAAGMNVIVLSAESIQAFPIGLEVAGQPVMPRLTELARESMHFVNHYEPTHLGSTSDAEFAVMQSLYPLPVGVVAARYARNHYRGLPAILGEQGYRTFSAVGARAHFWNMYELHPRYGFQRSYFEESFQITERIHSWISDGEYFTQMVPILAEQQEPFMGFLLSSSSHHPYVLPEHHRELRLGELEGTMIGHYLHSAHYFDRELGRFVDDLRASGLLDRTVLVIYGDHQGFLGNELEVPPLLGFAAWNEYQHFKVVKRTPLIIRLPHGVAAGVRTVTSNHLDVAPTVLSLLGIDDTRAVMLGRDLTRDGESLVIFRDGSFADGSHYYVNHFGRTLASRCYDADTAALVDCEPLEARRREARERLEVSDFIVQGDLIPSLTPR
jgi:lipoteichoic acid synthase